MNTRGSGIMGTKNIADISLLFCRIYWFFVLSSSLVTGSGVSNFQLVDSNQDPILLGDNDCIITLQFVSTASSFSLDARLNTGSTLDTSSAIIDTVGKNLTYTINKSLLSEDFGTYKLNLTLIPDTGQSASVDLTLYYEEPVNGVQVVTNGYVLVSSVVSIPVEIQKGSNFNVTWIYEPSMTLFNSYEGQTRNFSESLTFTTPGEQNISLYISNRVSDLSTLVTISAIYNLSGISISIEKEVILVTQDLTFKIQVDSSTQFPLGSIYLNVSTGNGNEIHKQLSVVGGSIDPVTYKYAVPGNYNISTTLYNGVDQIETRFSVTVWEEIQVTTTLVDDAKVSQPVLIEFQNLPTCIFSFNISYGNGDAFENTSDSMTSWNYEYTASGVFEVSIFAWTPVQQIQFNHTIEIHALTDVVSLEKVGQPSAISLESGEEANITLKFESNATKVTFELILEDGTAPDVSSAVIDYVTKTIAYTLRSSYLTHNFGSSKINFTLTPFYGASKTLLLDLFYEERVDGVSLAVPYFVLVNESTDLGLSVTAGSNFYVRRCIDDASCTTKNYTSVSEDLSQDLIIPSTGEQNVSVSVYNTLNNVNVTKSIFAIYRLNGLNVTITDTLVGSFDLVNFTTLASTDAKHPMGNLNLTLTIDDVTETHTIGSDLVTMDYSDHVVSYNCTVQGDYSPVVILYNGLDNITFTFSLRVWDQLFVELNFTNISKVFDPADFSFVNKPRSNFYYAIDYGLGDSPSVPAVDIKQPFNIMPWSHTFNNPGTFNINFTAWNDLYRVNYVYPITILPRDVTMFKIADGETAAVNLTEGSEAVVSMEFTSDAYDYVFTAKIMETGEYIDNSTTSFNISEGSLNYTIHSSYVNQPFGVYNLQLTLSPMGGSSLDLQVTVYYEEAITGLSMTGFDYLPVGDTTLMKATMTSASNVNFTWTIAPNVICNGEQTGTVREIQCSHLFTSPSEYNITIYVFNALSEATITVNVTVNHKINGFSFVLADQVVATMSNVTIQSSLANSADQPMGTLAMSVGYGDTHTDAISLNQYLSGMQTGTFDVSHIYSTQGNYTINVTIESEVDRQTFQLDVYIWDPLDVSLVSVTEVKVFNPVTFKFVNESISGFKFKVDYGDGNVYERTDSSILYSPFNIPAWNYTYSTAGTFLVIFTGWNEYYQVTNEYNVTVLPRNLSKLEIADNQSSSVYLIDGDDAIVIFAFESDALQLSLDAVLVNDGSALDNTSVTFDMTSSRIEYTIKSSLVPMSFGMYNINVTVTAQGGNALSLDLVLFYEEAITGLSINSTQFLPVYENITFLTTLSSGSNMQVEVVFDDVYTYVYHIGRFTEQVLQPHLFTTTGQHNISVTANNTVSNATLHKTITTMYRLNGLSVSEPAEYFQTTENATIDINLIPTANIPMGTVKFNVSYGDWQEEQIELDEEAAHTHNYTFQVHHRYTIQGNYTVRSFLSNELDSMEFSFVIYVWDHILLSLSSKTTEKVFVPIEFTFTDPPNSAFYYVIDYGDGHSQSDTTSNLSSIFNVAPWTYTYNQYGEYNVTVKAWNPFYYRTCFQLVSIFPRNVTKFEIADNGTDVVKLLDGDETTVILEYESDAPSYTFDAFFATNQIPLNSSTSDINLSTMRVTYIIKSSYISEAFGTYEVDLRLSPSGGYYKTKRITLHYEEEVTGLSMTQHDFLPLNEEILYNATLLSGSNVDITWTFGSLAAYTFQIARFNENIFYNFSFAVPGDHNISVSAVNNVSSVFESMVVTFIYKLNGFSIPTLLRSFETDEVATLPFLLAQTAELPMGTLSCNISYGDGDTDSLSLNPNISSLQAGTYEIQHTYTLQGNYSVQVDVGSEIDSSQMSAFIYVWNAIHVSLNSTTEEKVFNPVEFQFHNPPKWGFLYEVDYGNNQWRHGLDVDVYSLFSIDPWNYTYESPGQFNVSLKAWNAFYVRSCVYQVIILPRDVTALDIEDGGAFMLNLAKGDMVGVVLTYQSDAFNYNLSAVMNTGSELDTSSAIINQASSEVSYNISSSMMNDYGTYAVNLTLDPDGGAARSLEIVIFYEEPISGFSISRYPYVPINESFLFTVTLSRGSNIEIEWYLEDMCLTEFSGTPTLVYHNFTFSVPGVHNVTAVAENSVSSAFDSMLIYVYYRINGISILSANATVQTTEYYIFTVFLNSTALQPMGTLKVNMTYGDGQTETVDLNSNFTEMLTTGFDIPHMYTIQGNYTASAVIYTEIDTQELSFFVYIWDKLEMVLNYPLAAKVDELVTFDFLYPPNSGFHFFIEYDDTETLDRSDIDMFASYSVVPWTKKYTTNNIYNITLRAWNDWYSVSCPYVITIQYPIPAFGITLLPVSDEIPVPDGIVVFNMTLVENEISPTDVFCTFDYNDGKDENVSTAIDFRVPVMNTYNYTYGGEKFVNFSCWNLVSSMIKRSYIMVREFTVEDFLITYQNPVNMNMTIGDTIPNAEHDLNKKAVHIPVNTTFYVSLFNCSRFPPDVYFTWDFGDGILEEPELIQFFHKTHQFDERGTYTVSIDIYDERTENETTKYHSITMGVIDFTVDPMVGIVDIHTFTFRATGIMGSATYKFDSYSNETMSYTSHGPSAEATVMYTLRGSYLVSVVGKNGTISEQVYLEQLVKIDFSIDNQLNMTVSNYSVYMPSGEINITLSLTPGSERKPEVTCVLLSGDLIDTDTHELVRNITVEEPLEFHYFYLTLGYHQLQVNCSNLASSTEFSTMIDVYNPCFTRDGIFDRQYSKLDKAMKSLTSISTYLTSRMGVICSEKHPQFQWSISSVDKSTLQRTHRLTQTTDRGTFVFTPGLLDPGAYYIRLNVSLDGTWISEFTYMEFEKPPPYAFIIGGVKTTARIIARNHYVDALTGSYDPDGGYGSNGDLTFSWNCSRVDSADFDVIESAYYNDTFDGPCDTQNASRGILRLNVSEGLYGFILTVTVHGSDKESTFTQMIKVIEGEPPDVAVNCTLNCFDKIAVQSKVNMVAWCRDCLDWERPDYVWSLEAYNNASGKFEEVDDFQSMINTEITEESVVIGANMLEEGMRYQLILQASAEGRNGTTVAMMNMTVNYPPYGGLCYFSPNEGRAALDFFVITCKSWHDEGINLLQNETRDTTTDEPLMYLYEADTTYSGSGANGTEKTELYKGGESTLINITLAVGDPDNDYKVLLSVHVIDRFGDSTTVRSYVKVTEDTSYVSNEAENTTAVEELFNKIEYTYNITDAGGNDNTVVRLVGSSGSLLKENSSSTTTVSEADILSGSVTEINDTEQTSLTALYIEKLKWMTGVILKAVGADNSSTVQKQLSPSDSQQAMRAIASCLKKSSLLTNEVLNDASQIAKTLIESIQQKSFQKPYPVQDITSLLSTVDVTVEVIESTLQNLVPDTVYDLDEEISVESIFEELKANDPNLQNPQNSTTTALIEEELLQKANLLYKLRSQQRTEQVSKAGEAEKSVPKLMDSIDFLQNAKLKTIEVGEGPTTFTRNGLNISIQKISVDKLSNTTQAAVGEIQVQFDEINSNNTNSSGTIDIKQTVFDKPPQIYGAGTSSLSSKAVLFSTNSDIIPSINIPNQGVAFSKKYKPVINTKDPDGLVYLQFPVANDGDAAIVYIKPENFDINAYAEATLYRIYAKALTIPSSSSFQHEDILDRRSWTTYGFKTFIPQNLLKKGEAYLGLKPLGASSQVTEAPPSLTTASPSRRKRSAGGGVTVDDSTVEATTISVETTLSPQFVPSEVEFNVVIATTGCRSWDESRKAWVSDGCLVLAISDLNSTVCRCPSSAGNIFATTFVAPNTIDFATVWGKFDASNAAVYATIIALIVLYIIGVIILRRKDKRDLIKWQTHFLCDSDSSDCYFYLLTVQTGLKRRAGTKSRVHFVLTGEDLDSGVRMLSDGVQEGFESASVRTFFMGTQEPLGDLKYLRIWHDNSGENDAQSWYLNSVVIDDVQTNIRYTFLCERWLAFDEDDGMIERILPTCGTENVTKFNTLFSQHTQFNITENHLWLSILIRPQKSTFTRVQRLSCLMALLFLTMIANAMFFRSSDEEEVSADQVQVGFMRFSFTTLYVSFIGIMITTPPILFVTYVYKNCKQKPQSSSKTDKSLLQKMITSQSETKKRKDNHEVTKEVEVINADDFYTIGNPRLPYKTLYVAWAIVFLAVAVSAFFLLLYSMEWGKSKAEEWLSSFMFSFLESVIVVDPLKVVLIAVLFALLFKKPVNNDTPVVDVDKLRTAASKCNSSSLRTYLDFWNDIFLKTKTCSKDHLESMRIRREKEMKAVETLMTIILYTVYAFIVYSISYIERDQRSYNFKSNVDNFLYTNTKSQFGFDTVRNTSGYIYWLNNTFVPTYYPQYNFNDQLLSGTDLKWFRDLSNVQVGPGRLRQLRTPKDKCSYDRLTWPTPCVDNYNFQDQDEDSYCVGWQPYTDAACGTDTYKARYLTADAWKYVDAEEIWGVPISGVYDTYAGGGYILKFTKNFETARLMIDELSTHEWIDRSTRAVFLEFTLYNANTNLFIYAVFLTEFPDTGGIITWIQTQTFRPILSLGGMGAYAILCYSIFMIQLIYMTVKTILTIKKLGACRFLKVTWNIVDTLCVILSYLAIAMFCCRIIYANKAMQILYDDRLTGENRFINFQHIVIWDSVYNVIIGILVFVVTLRFLRILGYNKRFTQISAVVTSAWKELSGFSVVFGIVFFGYVFLGYLLFGNTLREYKGIYTSWGSLTNALIGKNSLDSMIRAAPEMAQFFYFTYVFCIVFTLMTMFAAILNQSISEVKSDIQSEPDTYGVTDVIKNSIKGVLDIFIKKKGNTAQKKKQEPNKLNQYGKNFQVDAPNILRFVRETFDDIGENQDSENEDSGDQRTSTPFQAAKGDEEVIINAPTQRAHTQNDLARPASSPNLRAETPADIQVAVDENAEFDIKDKSEYLAYL